MNYERAALEYEDSDFDATMMSQRTLNLASERSESDFSSSLTDGLDPELTIK